VYLSLLEYPLVDLFCFFLFYFSLFSFRIYNQIITNLKMIAYEIFHSFFLCYVTKTWQSAFPVFFVSSICFLLNFRASQIFILASYTYYFLFSFCFGIYKYIFTSSFKNTCIFMTAQNGNYIFLLSVFLYFIAHIYKCYIIKVIIKYVCKRKREFLLL
jgi:hypothetical protein